MTSGNSMDAAAMTRHIRDTFDGIQVTEHAGDTFFSLEPEGDQWLMFATVVTSPQNDGVTALGEPGVYRLNIGLTKATYTARFGPAPTERDERGVFPTGHDHNRPGRLTPHPHYASQHWVCVLNPADDVLDDVRALLDEAYRFAARKAANRKKRTAVTGRSGR